MHRRIPCACSRDLLVNTKGVMMRYYAIFHAYVGDRSVFRLDGRNTIYNMHLAAIAHAKAHKMKRGTYSIERGSSLLRTFALSKPRKLSDYVS